MINNLQVARAFAAINVVIFHVTVAPPDQFSQPWLFENFNSWGASGVDVFFVLSGFIMVYTQTLKPKPIAAFALARITRIAPIYWVITVVWAGAIYVTSDFDTTYANPVHIGASLFFLSQVLGLGSPFISPGWTLEFEMMFYGVFALSLAFQKSLFVVGAALLFLVLFVGINPIVIEFLFGMLAGHWYFSNRRWPSPTIIASVGLIGLLYSFFANLDTNNMDPLERAIVWGLPSLLLVAGLSRMPQISSGTLTFLGTASYSIYLSHWCGIRLFEELMSVISAPAIDRDLYILACTTFCVLLGSVVFKYIETPISKALTKRSSKRVNLANLNAKSSLK